jgi:hypothetical protein
MSTAAKYGGNAPLTPSQAVSYNNLSNEVAAQYAQEDRATHSPFDATNSNTFLGMIVGQLIPYASSLSSVSGILSSVASITTGSFASLTSQTAKAASTDDYTMCQDYDYRDMNLATDPYCNVAYGIPPEYLNADPVVVAQKLIADKQIDEETGDPIDGSAYATFVTNCMDRTQPLGADSSGSTGSECKIDNSNKDYYIHYIDQRVQTGLDGDQVAPNSTTATNPTPTTPSSGDAQQLAKEILANDKISYIPAQYTTAHVSPKQDVQDAADGKVGSAGVMTDIRILKLIATIGQTHSVEITAIQSGGMGHCNNTPKSACPGDPHYIGKGLDIDKLDGTAVSGRNPPSITIINIAEGVWTAGRFGQDGCSGKAAPKPSGWVTFPDSCNHLHLDVVGV